MEIQLWRELLHPYEQAVSELIVKFNSLKMEFSKNSLYSPIESVQGRVKTVSSILEKMKKKGIPFEHLEDMVEDIAGIRIICQFVEDIEKVSTLIRMRSDMEVLQQKNYLENKKASGYRSYHLIVSYVVETIKGPKRIRVEIQIRTMVSQVRSEIIDAQIDSQIQTGIVKDILTCIENLYHVASEREVLKIQNEFYRIFMTNDIEELKRFQRQLDIFAEGYRAQSVDSKPL